MRNQLFMLAVALSCLSASGQGLKVGDPAPLVTIDRILTPGASTEFYKGKFLVLDFWATWCAPCIAGFPNINELHGAFREDSLVFAVITYEEGSKVQRFFREKKGIKINAYNLVDRADTFSKYGYNGKTFNDFEIQSIPTTFVIDPQGTIRWKGNAHELTKALIQSLMSGKVNEPTPSISNPVQPRKVTKNYLDSFNIDGFEIKTGIAGTPFPGYSKTGPGLIAYRGEQIHTILLNSKGWHKKQVDTTGLKTPVPFVEFQITGDKKTGRDQLIRAAMKALAQQYGYLITVENRTYNVYELELVHPARLLKNAAAFDPNSGHSSSMPGEQFFYAVNFKLDNLVPGILKYMIRDSLLILKEAGLKKVQATSFDFKVPNGDFKSIVHFLYSQYGIRVTQRKLSLPTLVLKQQQN